MISLVSKTIPNSQRWVTVWVNLTQTWRRLQFIVEWFQPWQAGLQGHIAKPSLVIFCTCSFRLFFVNILLPPRPTAWSCMIDTQCSSEFLATMSHTSHLLNIFDPTVHNHDQSTTEAWCRCGLGHGIKRGQIVWWGQRPGRRPTLTNF